MIQIPCKIFIWERMPFKVIIPIQDKVILKYNLNKLHIVHYEYELLYMGEILKDVKRTIEDKYIDGYAYLDKEEIIALYYQDKEDLNVPTIFLPAWLLRAKLTEQDLKDLKQTVTKLYSSALAYEYMKRNKNGNYKL